MTDSTASQSKAGLGIIKTTLTKIWLEDFYEPTQQLIIYTRKTVTNPDSNIQSMWDL